MTHKEKMTTRRIRQLSRQRGFSAVPNARVDATRLEIQVASAMEKPNQMLIASLQAHIPTERMFMRTRPYNERSKYNQENTRGNR